MITNQLKWMKRKNLNGDLFYTRMGKELVRNPKEGKADYLKRKISFLQLNNLVVVIFYE